MDLINGDFETINLQALRKVDLIFINYEELFKSDDAKDFPRRFHEIIKKSFSITRNIVIIFPKTLKLTNLVTLFGGSMELLEKEVY